MHLSGSGFIYSATDVSGHLACAHLTSLNQRQAAGGPEPPYFPDPGTEVLRRRGQEHEHASVDRFETEGLEVVRGPERGWDSGRDGWKACAAETLELMRSGVDVIHQGTLFDGSWLGLPDFLRRVDRPSDLGDWSYEVIDAKLARSAKAGAVLQTSFYSELLALAQCVQPEYMHLALGRPEDPLETFRVADYAAYYRFVKTRFLAAVQANGNGRAIEADTEFVDLPTYPEPCDHCRVCDWSPVCKEQWRSDDHLSLVAGISRKQRSELNEAGVTTLAELAAQPLETRLDGISPQAFEKIREQARIQLDGRREDTHRYELFEAIEKGRGLLAMPAPSEGDIFFDIEADPYVYDHGLEYLLGSVDGEGAFTAQWALEPNEERQRFEEFIDWVTARLEEWPDLHIYHFGHYERSALQRLAGRHAIREDELDQLLRGEVFVDLHRVVKQGLRASVERYSIKDLEPFYGYERTVELREARSALADFEAWLHLGGEENDELLHRIEAYNRDDCLSTLQLRDWLEERRNELEQQLGEELQRPEPAQPEPSEGVQEENERVQALNDSLLEGVPADPNARSAEQQAGWILSHLFSWHRREKKSMWWEYFNYLDMDEDGLLHDSKAIGGLEYEGGVGEVKRSLIHRYRFPPQDFRLRTRDRPHDPRTESSAGQVVDIDEVAGTIDLKRGKSSDVPHPAALIPFENIRDDVLRESLWRLGDDVVENGLASANNRAAVNLLLRDPPRVGQTAGSNPRQPGETALDAARRLATQLDGTVLPVQGPPGSGKTFIGGRMIATLLAEGKRVGVTANSHKVIVNLLDEVCAVADNEGVLVRGVQKAKKDSACAHDSITAKDDNADVHGALTGGEANLVGGTVWLWSRPEMAESVDVLFVDEAGQMSLANVLAASQAADSIVLLGDPRQLEQPQQGVHPPGTDLAALEYLVGETTLESFRGLFLEETYRLHPDICAFTSEVYYEGRLTSRPDLAGQRVDAAPPFGGAGLRFVPVEHSGNTSESPEEVKRIEALLRGLFAGTPRWVDSDGNDDELRLEDVLVVAPYNAQVAALRAALPPDAHVGTVDKFQGQQAAIVIYSTTTSTAEDAPRGMSFLYSPNRLNVATSRARCIAMVVGSPALFAPSCASVRQMRLANGFCRFSELAEEPTNP